MQDRLVVTPGTALTLLLAALIGLNPFAMDAYLPAMAAIADDFDTTLQRIEHSISTYMLGYAAGMLLAAPVSDRLGRRPVTLFGMVFFCLATVWIITVNSAAGFNAARILQGLGSGAALVSVGAIVRDLFDEHDSARQLSMITILLLVLPLIAPVFGSAVLLLGSWRWVFVGLLAYAVVMTALVVWRLPETVAAQDDATKAQSALVYLVHHVRSVLNHRRATAYAMVAAFGASTLFLSLSDSAFVYLVYFGLTPQQFPLAFGANVILMGLAHFTNIRLLNRYRPRQILPFGVGLMVANAAGFTLYTLLADEQLLPTMGFIMTGLASQSLIVTNAIAAYMSRFSTNAGMANAISGALIFIVGGCAALLLGELHDSSPLSLAVSFLLAAIAAGFMTLIALGEKR